MPPRVSALKANRLRVLAKAVPLLGRLGWRLVRDSRVPRGHRAVLLGAVGYLASPLDLLPDVIPILGELDDLLVLAAGLAWLLNFTPREVLDEHLGELGVTRDELDRTLTLLMPLPLMAAYQERHRYLPKLTRAVDEAAGWLNQAIGEVRQALDARHTPPARPSSQSPV